MGQIRVTKALIEGLYIIDPAVHGDNCGYFMGTYNQRGMEEAGLNIAFVQDKPSMSAKGGLRILHFKKRYPSWSDPTMGIEWGVVSNYNGTACAGEHSSRRYTA